MTRPRYPSDDHRLKPRQHVKIHLTMPSHPRYGHVWADLELRGIWVGVLMFAMERFAARRNDQVWLSGPDAMWLTGREKERAAWIVLNRLLVAMNWRVAWLTRDMLHNGSIDLAERLQRSSREALDDLQKVCGVLVEVRNFARKQGFLRDSTRTPSPPNSEFRVPNSDSEEKKNSEKNSEKKEKEPSPPAPALPLLSGLPADQKSRKPRAVNGHCLMPDKLDPEQVERLKRLAKKLGKTEDQLRYAATRVRDWSQGNGKARRDWVLVIISAIKDGWAMKGYTPPAQAYIAPSSPGWHLPELERKQA